MRLGNNQNLSTDVVDNNISQAPISFQGMTSNLGVLDEHKEEDEDEDYKANLEQQRHPLSYMNS